MTMFNSPAMRNLARSMAREMGLPPTAFLPRKIAMLPPPPVIIDSTPKTVEEVAAAMPTDAAYPPLKAIRRAVAIATGVPVMDIISERRHAPAVRARAIFYYAARELTPKSLLSIGKACGNRDHTTILHGCQRVAANRQAFEPELSKVITALRGAEE